MCLSLFKTHPKKFQKKYTDVQEITPKPSLKANKQKALPRPQHAKLASVQKTKKLGPFFLCAADIPFLIFDPFDHLQSNLPIPRLPQHPYKTTQNKVTEITMSHARLVKIVTLLLIHLNFNILIIFVLFRMGSGIYSRYWRLLFFRRPSL